MKVNNLGIRKKHEYYFKYTKKSKTFNACSKCFEATKSKFGTKEYKYICDKCFSKLSLNTNEIKYNGDVLEL